MEGSIIEISITKYLSYIEKLYSHIFVFDYFIVGRCFVIFDVLFA